MPRNLLTGGAFRSKLFSELLDGESPPPQLAEGSLVGPWRISRLLGRGGMSEVYLAERSAGDFDQTVAIKIIAANVDAAELLREERRILGRLRHPAIATLIDGGELACGSVWLAMEYVDGEPIDSYAEIHALGWAARLSLVERLCEAVDHAHRHLLVHRDIKPSNVLVDARGNAKLIDFGIALAEHGQDKGQRWLTPGFAAPEQLRGEAITTATDIYQLGQLLRTLTTIDVLPDAPPGPSARDLQRIVARATRPLPAERYGSPAELAADLAALREQRPLPDQRTPILQRLRLWRLRHAWAPWVAVPVAITLAVSATLAVQSALREADERAMALREEQVATAIGAFFVDLFTQPVAATAGAPGVTALLDDGQRRLLARPNARPEIQAALLYQLAQSNAAMERRGMAVELLEEAARVQRQANLAIPLALSNAALAQLHALAGDAASGEALASEASRLLQVDRRIGRDRFLALTQLGEYYGNTFAFARATTVLREALAVGEQRYGAASAELHRAHRLLVGTLQNQWQVAEALPLGDSLVARCQQHFGADDARCIVDLIQQQRMRALAGDTRGARATYDAVWRERTSWEGTLRHYRVHAIRFGLANVDAIDGDLGVAQQRLLDSLCDLARAETPGGPHWISDRGAQALLLLDMGATAAALAVSSEARDAFMGDGARSLESAFWAVRQAKIEYHNGAIEPATGDAVRDAVARTRSTYGPRSYFSARAELALAMVEAAAGRKDEALALLDRAEAADAQGLYYFHPQLLAEVDTLRATLGGDPAGTATLLARAEQRLTSVYGRRHVLAAAAELRTAAARQRAGDRVDPDAVVVAYRHLAAQQVPSSPDLALGRQLLQSLGQLAAADAAPATLVPMTAVECD